MDQVFFRVPFASSGDTSTIPESVTADGSASWPEGWGVDYEKNMSADAHAKAVEREVMNFMFNAVTVALRQYQTAAFPEFITAADNNGTAFAYSSGTVIRYRASSAENFKNYVSIANNNTATPGTDISKWQEFIFEESSEQEATQGESGVKIITPRRLKKVTNDLEESIINAVTPFILPVGAIILWGDEEAPQGWLELNGQFFDVDENPQLAKRYPSGQVPDWRGRVPRGWARGSSVDPDSDREIGSFQDDAMQRLTGTMTADSFAGDSSGVFYLGGSAGKQAGSGHGTARYFYFDNARQARTADENRMKNVAAMYIIKTDLSDSDNSTNLPTALVPSPGSAIIEQGTTLQCTASVLPESLAAGFPVNWSVSDSELGSIDETGLYTAASDVSGTQTIIASITTGLVATISVVQHIYLSNVTIGAIPDLTVSEDTYAPNIVYTPSNYTEPLEYNSSDDNVVSFAYGQLFPNGDGSATISVKGSYSGVTATQRVTVNAVVVEEKYLAIANNLGEIATAGEVAQKESRENLGLGELAEKDSLTADEVGAVGLAADGLADVDLNDLTQPGEYFQNVSSNATAALNYPVEIACAIKVYPTGVSDGACRQEVRPYNSNAIYSRYGYGEPIVFSDWEIVSNGGNDPVDLNRAYKVGSILIAAIINNGGEPLAYAATIAGTGLRVASAHLPHGQAGGGMLSTTAFLAGTWRHLGFTNTSGSDSAAVTGTSYPVSLFIRIL